MSLLSAPLQAFIAVVQTQSVHAASRSIGLTQTGVTQRIRSLESSLSTTLFIRSRKGMQPTREGQALYRYCQGVLDLEGLALSQIQGELPQHRVEFSIIGPTSALSSRVIPQCENVMRKQPELLMRFQVSDREDRIEELRSGRVHLAVVEPRQVAREMESRMLKPEKYILVGSQQWKKRAFKDILQNERLIDFNSEDQTSFQYLKQFDLLELANKERHFVNNNEGLICLLEKGAGYGVLSEEVARPLLQRKQLVVLNGGKSYAHPIALAWYPRPEMPTYFRAILEAIR